MPRPLCRQDGRAKYRGQDSVRRSPATAGFFFAQQQGKYEKQTSWSVRSTSHLPIHVPAPLPVPINTMDHHGGPLRQIQRDPENDGVLGTADALNSPPHTEGEPNDATAWPNFAALSGQVPLVRHQHDAVVPATRLQMVRYSPKSGHWASVCLLSGVKRTKINGPQNFRS